MGIFDSAARSILHKLSDGKQPPDRNIYGGTGTLNYSGYIYGHEYNTDLQSVRGIDVVDKMMADGTVYATYQLISLPIRAAKWNVQECAGLKDIEPDALAALSPDEKAQRQRNDDIREFVESNLFDREDTWDEFLTNALFYLPYGRMAFEKIWDFDRETGRWYWKTLSPRLPRSIYRWVLDTDKNGKRCSGLPKRGDDSLDYISQWAQKQGAYSRYDVPAEKLMLFTNQKSGQNYEGRGLFRSAYKHWFYKDKLYEIAAMAAEREGMGVPWGQLPSQSSPERRAEFHNVLQNIRAHENLEVLLNSDENFGIMGVHGRAAADPLPLITHHDNKIADQVLAQFYMLGATQKGSRAVADVQQDPFYLAIQAAARQVEDVLNWHIKELVDENYAGVEDYPVVRCENIQPKNVPTTASAVESGAKGGMDFSDRPFQQWYREQLGAPPLPPEDELQKVPTGPGEPNPQKSVKAPEADGQEDGGSDFDSAGGQGGTAMSEPYAHVHLAASVHPETGILSVKRPPRGAEMHVALADIADSLNSNRDRLRNMLQSGQKAMIAPLKAAAKRSIRAKDTTELKNMTLRTQSNLAAQVAKVMADNFRAGRKEVRDELDRQRAGQTINPLIRQRQDGQKAFNLAEPTDADLTDIPTQTMTLFNAQGDLTASQVAARMKAATIAAANQAIHDGLESDDEIDAAIDPALEDAASGGIARLADYANGGFGRGRGYEASQQMDDIEYGTYSAILDSNTCAPCDSMEGTTYGPGKDAALSEAPEDGNPDCDGGPLCRCMVIWSLAAPGQVQAA